MFLLQCEPQNETYFCSSRMSKTLSANHRFLLEISPPGCQHVNTRHMMTHDDTGITHLHVGVSHLRSVSAES